MGQEKKNPPGVQEKITPSSPEVIISDLYGMLQHQTG